MSKTKIEWCDRTWNPIVGCRHDCPYCYAKKQAKRFAGDIRMNINNENCVSLENGLYEVTAPIIGRNGHKIAFPCGFEPALMSYRLNEPSEWNASQNVFVGSMADVFGSWVPDEWIDKVMESCYRNSIHNYLFLTKNYSRYEELDKKQHLLCTPNMWYGCSFTRPTEIRIIANDSFHTFVSLEPLLGDIGFELQLRDEKVADWVIIGAETGQNKNKVIPTKAWINHIVEYCDNFNIPVFMKNSLIGIVGEENMRREFPAELSKRKPLTDKQEAVLIAACGKCGKTLPKRKMYAINSRKGRHGKVLTVGYICENCYPDFTKGLKSNGKDNRGGGA